MYTSSHTSSSAPHTHQRDERDGRDERDALHVPYASIEKTPPYIDGREAYTLGEA